ncbi:hypothetical protein EV681_0057 [Advenella incenata]|uniref:Uncharacterized protein n=1 Tax=Advenella incenata TaxID=267800 RepID=A0A4Q7VPD4_9BURK|nr:hypothetical protein EV681_0057 [Advenella incenata]
MIESYYWLASNHHRTTMFPDEAWLIHQTPHFVDIGLRAHTTGPGTGASGAHAKAVVGYPRLLAIALRLLSVAHDISNLFRMQLSPLTEWR